MDSFFVQPLPPRAIGLPPEEHLLEPSVARPNLMALFLASFIGSMAILALGALFIVGIYDATSAARAIAISIGVVGAGALAAIVTGLQCRRYLRRLKDAQLIHEAAKRHYTDERAERIASASRQARDYSLREAVETTERARALALCGSILERLVARSVRRAASDIARSKIEYESSAFGPFWDAVESSACHLGETERLLRISRDAARAYYATLAGRIHNFPAYPANLTTPSSVSCTRRLNELARLGQTNIHFALVWEHRQTRKILIAGFETLSEGLAHLECAVTAALQDLTAIIDLGFRDANTTADRTYDVVSILKNVQQEALILQRGKRL
jgi:hypothetical protein